MQRNSSQPAWPVWLSWLEYHPVDQKVMGLIPSQGTCLGCGFGPWLGRIWQATNRSFFLSPSPYLPLSLRSKSVSWGKEKEKKGTSSQGTLPEEWEASQHRWVARAQVKLWPCQLATTEPAHGHSNHSTRRSGFYVKLTNQFLKRKRKKKTSNHFYLDSLTQIN